MSNSFYHKDLTDAQWNRIKFLFEEPVKVGRPSLEPRTVFNGIMWMVASGARWRDLPFRYGNWNSIYHKFRHWCRLNLFERLLNFLNADAQESTLLEIDSTFCKVHQCACSACIPDKVNSKVKHDFDAQLYKQRNIVERFFQRVKNYRRIATRYDRLATCFENFFLLATSLIQF